jgi:hypothetical protein
MTDLSTNVSPPSSRCVELGANDVTMQWRLLFLGQTRPWHINRAWHRIVEATA